MLTFFQEKQKWKLDPTGGVFSAPPKQNHLKHLILLDKYVLKATFG